MTPTALAFALTPFLQLDLFPLLAGMLAAVGCGLLGNFLVLRKLSLMGDAISHSVLPGLVIAFLVASSRNPFVMFAGAAIAGIATVVLVELVKRFGRVEPGAAMGVVFSVLFALGVLLIEKASARHTDLDADCVLYGQLETLTWYTAPETLAGLLSAATLDAIPRQVVTLAAMVVLATAFIVVFFKELRLAAFDPALATTQGYSATLLHYLLMVFVAAATVASFEAVGSILVIAMLICPAATARLMTDKLQTQIWWSVLFALVASIGGYFSASAIPQTLWTLLPSLFGGEAMSASGMMTVCAGLLLTAAMIASPKHGVIQRTLRQRELAIRIAVDDVLADLFRADEKGQDHLTLTQLTERLAGRPIQEAVKSAETQGLLSTDEAASVTLTEQGKEQAAGIIRKHRLWERYLVDQAGFAPDHVHDPAEQLEHISTLPPEGPDVDPHGKPVPK